MTWISPLNGIGHRYVIIRDIHVSLNLVDNAQFCHLTINIDLDLEPIRRKLLHDASIQNGEIMLR